MKSQLCQERLPNIFFIISLTIWSCIVGKEMRSDQRTASDLSTPWGAKGKAAREGFPWHSNPRTHPKFLWTKISPHITQVELSNHSNTQLKAIWFPSWINLFQIWYIGYTLGRKRILWRDASIAFLCEDWVHFQEAWHQGAGPPRGPSRHLEESHWFSAAQSHWMALANFLR